MVHPITQADSLYVLIGPVRARTPYPLLGARCEDPLPSPGRGWQGEALTGVGRNAEPTWYRPSSAAGSSRPLLLGEGAAAAAGVEGTPKTKNKPR